MFLSAGFPHLAEERGERAAGFPHLAEERGERAGPPSPQEGDTLDPDPVEPGEVAGTPVTSWNREQHS